MILHAEPLVIAPVCDEERSAERHNRDRGTSLAHAHSISGVVLKDPRCKSARPFHDGGPFISEMKFPSTVAGIT